MCQEGPNMCQGGRIQMSRIHGSDSDESDQMSRIQGSDSDESDSDESDSAESDSGIGFR